LLTFFHERFLTERDGHNCYIYICKRCEEDEEQNKKINEADAIRAKERLQELYLEMQKRREEDEELEIRYGDEKAA